MSRTNGYLMKWSPKLNCRELRMLHCKYIQWNDCGINVISSVQHNTIMVIPLYIFAVYTVHRCELICCCRMILPIIQGCMSQGMGGSVDWLFIPCTVFPHIVAAATILFWNCKTLKISNSFRIKFSLM